MTCLRTHSNTSRSYQGALQTSSHPRVLKYVIPMPLLILQLTSSTHSSPSAPKTGLNAVPTSSYCLCFSLVNSSNYPVMTYLLVYSPLDCKPYEARTTYTLLTIVILCLPQSWPLEALKILVK